MWRLDARADANVVGVDASPKHMTATCGTAAVQLDVPFVTVARMVCATVPVIGADSTRSLTARTRFARAADTGVLRTFAVTVAFGATALARNFTDASASWSGASSCGYVFVVRARTARPPSGRVATAVMRSTRTGLAVPLWSSSATRPSTGADCATTATPDAAVIVGVTLPCGDPGDAVSTAPPGDAPSARSNATVLTAVVTRRITR
jgi:hypothetical protein